MPIEYALLKDLPEPFEICPKCGSAPFESFLRGCVQRWPFKFLFWWPRKYCCVICWKCKEIVGYE